MTFCEIEYGINPAKNRMMKVLLDVKDKWKKQ